MDFYSRGDFTADAIQGAGISFESMFEEIPVVMKNSHLANSLLCELEDGMGAQRFNFLDLATR